MKPLILILLFAISLQAQSLPEVARQERARKAVQKPSRKFTTDDARAAGTGGSTVKPPETPIVPGQSVVKPTEPAAKPADQTAKPADQAAKPAPAKPADDAVKRYNEQLSKLRARIVQLQDQEVALQLQLNDLKNQILAPVTDQTARAQAEAKRDQTQNQLAAGQSELATTRRSLQVLEAQGPPKP